MRLPAGLLALVLGALCAVAVACGSENRALLTERRADRLTGDIDRVAAAVQDGDCEATAVRLQELRSELAELPASLSPALRERLTTGAARLATQAAEECQGTRTETLETQEEPAPTPETTPTETTETETETEPPPTETEPPPTETEPEPPAETTPTTTAPTPDPADPADPAAPEGDGGTGGVDGGTAP